ncbi:hypothetical protein [uncultured Kordia sp.]|uniref:hypothetical protein n=1 Tax=uncultured Kordia sp. TaxID=507699 RepID=UPI00262F8571|nr:hypothetical protein [uncultured Kordia sp.]
MKLTQEEIRYIDEYLQQSGVQFWDVRLEILDHVATGVEEKMTHESMSFEEALEAITISFGNEIRQGYILNKNNAKWIPAGTFSDGEGFKKLQREKQKQIGKKHTKAYFRQLGNLLVSLKFYIELTLLILLMIVFSEYSEKWALGVGFIYLFYPFLIIIYKFIKGVIPKKSLHINMSMMGLIGWIHLLSFFPNVYEMIYDEKVSFQLFAGFLILMFPLIKAGFMRYDKVCEEYKEYYDLVTN